MPRIASTRTIIDENNLIDDVPIWMKSSVIAWIKKYTTVHRGRDRINNTRIEGVNTNLILAVERYLQITLPEDNEDEFELQNQLVDYVNDATHCLDVIEALLAVGIEYNFNIAVDEINRIFLESGSKWMAIVDQDNRKASLEERVDSTTISAFQLATSSPTEHSNELLKKAWSYAFGRNPNASEAYNYSIKAMEAASWPIIQPNNQSATLGHILGELRTNPNKWHSQITEKQQGISSSTLTNAMQLVWEGHTDRHGTANPVAVTQKAAEQAVFTAVMVCAYFNRNYVE